eukprot:TRINITY_DN66350_c3_g2_i1.p1 TRINITY_DN66350_c3_g2~~TRINITY_DN66350_c3_g2_i1.p1  ORF type:complete len:328 (+),score=43.25 TRINITY_DN66350_c3_g2_i1:51-1034(+)
MQAQQETASSHTFEQRPQTIVAKAKYRDAHGIKPAGSNLMWNQRVIRGNTYSAQVLPLSSQVPLAQAEKQARRQRRQIAKELRRAQEEAANRSTTPQAIEGRQHIEIQTEEYLEQLTDTAEENTIDTQTDPMMDRPPTPTFVPLKTGRDTETQIEAGDLWNFVLEVEPLLEVMVGNTLEQAMLEVQQEEELENIRQQQLRIQRARREEQMELERQEAHEKRKYQEKEHRKKQEMQRLKREQVTNEKLASRAYAQQLLLNLENNTFARLEDEGFFCDSTERQVDTEFMPWLTQQTDKNLESKRKTKRLLDALIEGALKKARHWREQQP